jgi:hypothetical protein
MIMENTVDGQTQNAQANALAESQKNEENQEAAKALNDFNALVSKLTQ